MYRQMKISRTFLVTIFTLLALLSENPCNSCFAQSLIFNSPNKYEVRAVWLTTIGGLDWPHCYAQSQNSIDKQKKELVEILDRLKAANFNTVLFQTRVRGTVTYPSSIEPWDGCCSGLPGKSPGYDPLEFAVEECHKRGIEIQAWLVAIPVGKWNAAGCKALRKKHPNMVVKIGADGYIDPSNPSAAPYIAGICREITEKYDIDGIHLDYIRYPENWNRKISNGNGRENITRIVRECNRQVKSVKPWVKLSCSPIGKFNDLTRYSSRGWNAYNKGCQDVRTWLSTGLMDQIYPMMYFRGNQFYPFALDWKENSFGKTIVPGLGIYFLSPSEGNWQLEEIQRQMYVSRANGMGYAMFRNKFLCDNIKGIYSFAKETFNLYPALIPPATWLNGTKPNAPQNIRKEQAGEYETIMWEDEDNEKEGGISYNLYASKNYPVNINDVRNLVAQKIKNKYITLKQSTGLFFAITSIDRYGNESTPLQEINAVASGKSNRFIDNDGKRMLIPDKGQTLDADYILIESLTGSTHATMPYKGKYADIRNLKDGFYKVMSVNRKGTTHRLGFLIVKRS